MGTFINEVAKNNALQKEYLTQKAAERAKKEAEKAERKNDAILKSSFINAKKEALQQLYFTFKNYYEKKGISAFNYLNLTSKHNEVISDILEDFNFLNSSELLEIELELDKKYLSYNNILYKNYYADIKSRASEVQPIQKEPEKSKHNWGENASILWLAFIGGFAAGFKPKKYNRKNYRF